MCTKFEIKWCFVSITMQDQLSLTHCPYTHWNTGQQQIKLKDLQSCLSLASFCMELQQWPKPLTSASTVRRKINYGNTKLNTNLTDKCQALLVYNVTF